MFHLFPKRFEQQRSKKKNQIQGERINETSGDMEIKKIKGHWNVMCDKKLQTKLLKLNQG